MPGSGPGHAILRRLLASRSSPALRLLSWNAKMMNKTDLADGEWERAASEKSANLADLARGAEVATPRVSHPQACFLVSLHPRTSRLARPP